ncbi:hypothetical protein [Halobacterium salinarum]|uniref:hypothetical protein n=1 Tax=Halobacterium salinarum TaxID=2242 RepID=UPI0025561D06|nr:hypothetical protein [Halobacterium salinarum]MDL0127045.1 hypothetical protein [Halobacterium salinarum]
MYDTLPKDAKKRLSGLQRDAGDQFDSRLLSDRIFTYFEEDDDIRQLLRVTELAYDLEEHDAQPDFIQTAGFQAAERLNDEIYELVEVVVARILEEFIEDARTGWFDDPESTATTEEVESAFHEACAWIREHEEACERAGFDSSGLVWSDDDGVVEVDA